MKVLVSILSLLFVQAAFADIQWQKYSEKALMDAQKKGHKVVLGFHKKGCGTCNAQDSALEEAGIKSAKMTTFLKVERKNSDHAKVYEMYGLTKRQWSVIVLLDGSKEVARINPGVTSGNQITNLVSKLK